MWKSSSEGICKKWDFIDFFIPPSKAINQVSLKTDFTISLQFQRVGSKVNLVLAYHWRCDFSFSNQRETKQEREQWWREGKQREPFIQCLHIPTMAALVCHRRRFTPNGSKWKGKIHHRENYFWVKQENLNPILELFLSGEIMSSVTAIWHSLQYIFLDLFSFAVAKYWCSSRLKPNKGFYSVPYCISVLWEVCLEQQEQQTLSPYLSEDCAVPSIPLSLSLSWQSILALFSEHRGAGPVQPPCVSNMKPFKIPNHTRHYWGLHFVESWNL